MSLPLLHAGRTNPGLSAALDLRFALDKSLTAYRGPTPSFSRASTGSYFDGSGVLRYAALNLLTYSEDFTNGVWYQQRLSVSSNSATSPIGTLTADKLIENNTGPNHLITYNTATTGTLFSIYAKAGERGWIALQQSSPGRYCYFDLVNGVVGTASGATGSISSAGNGWYRCSILVPSGSSVWDIFLATGDNGAGYTGNGTSGLFVWGAQLEASSTVGTYCPTTSSANSAPRFNHTFNGTSWVSRGLLVEEQRTNLLQRSEEFNTSPWTTLNASVSANAIASPDGNTTADKLVESATGPHGHEVYYLFTASTTTYTTSVFAKAAERSSLYISLGSTINNGVYFNLSNGTVGTATGGLTGQIQDVGNGWYRCSVTGALSAGTNYIQIALSNGTTYDYTGNGTSGLYLFGAQLETGSFATSYIGTTNSSVVRSADVCQITGSDFSGFWNGTEGTVAVEFEHGPASGDSCLYMVAGGSTDPQSTVFITGGNIESSGYNGSSIYALNFGSWSSSTAKICTGFKTNDFAGSLNGGAALTDTSGTLSTAFNRLQIGRIDWGGGAYWNGHIARLRYYRKRLPNATLQLLSEPDPTLNLQFALNKTLTPVAGPAPSFSRASTGSYFDASGVLRYAAVNILNYSEDFTNAYWLKARQVITANAIASPNGDLSAEKLAASNGATVSATAYRTTLAVSSSTSYTVSIYAKKAEWDFLAIGTDGAIGSGGATTWFNLNTGAVGTVNHASAAIQSVGNGWYRCSISGTTSTTNLQIFFNNAQTNNSTVIAGDGTSGIYIWGAQVEASPSPTQYAKTEASTTAGPRFDHVYSGGQWVSRGLLIEEQRTNSFLNSEQFDNATWLKFDSTTTANAGTAPDGTVTADKCVPNTNSANHGIYNSSAISISSGTQYTVSLFAKASGYNFLYLVCNVRGSSASTGVCVNLTDGTQSNGGASGTYTVTNVGDGWWRIACTATASSTSGYIEIWPRAVAGGATSTVGNGTDGVLIWGAQIETGSFATSYIGTTSSPVVRSADVCQITGTSFGWMWNQGEGSVAIECDRLFVGTADNWLYKFNASAGVDNINHQFFNGNDYSRVFYSGAPSAIDYGASSSAGIITKFSGGFSSSGYVGTKNGIIAATKAITTIGTGHNELIIGNGGTSASPANFWNGHITKLLYYPARLTNTKLQQLST